MLLYRHVNTTEDRPLTADYRMASGDWFAAFGTPPQTEEATELQVRIILSMLVAVSAAILN